MLKGYWVANVDISNLDEYKKYAMANAVPFNKYGGKFLTRGGKSEMVEGKFRSRVVLIEFPSFEAALACYRSPEYAAVKKLRESASVADIVVLKGYDGPRP
ncbi:MAG: DUF1330 domain-containing protein [Pseudolabrys sp.]